MNCQFCGWGEQAKTQFGEHQCSSREEAVGCDLNQINRQKYWLRCRPEVVPPCVRSVRYQGREGKGDCYERLEPA